MALTCVFSHNQVDIRCTGQVKWEQLCSYLLLEYTERERASVPKAALQDSQQLIRHCSHNKVLKNFMECVSISQETEESKF